MLEASPEQLARAAAKPAATPAPAAPAAPPATAYPPLEPRRALTSMATDSGAAVHQVAVAGASGRMGHMLIEAIRAAATAGWPARWTSRQPGDRQ